MKRLTPVGGMRGGLAPSSPPAPVPAPGAAAMHRPAPAAAGLGDRLTHARASLRNTRWTLAYVGFLLYVAGATTQRFAVGDVAVAAALIGLLFEKEHRVPPMLWWLIALVAWSAFGLAISQYPRAIDDPLSVLLKLTVILFAAVNCMRTRSQVRVFMILWLACYGLYPVRGALLNYFVVHNTSFGRAIWNRSYSNPNDLAAITLLLFAVAAALLLAESKGWVRRAVIAGLPVLALLIFLTQSRAGIIGFAVLTILALPVTSRKGARLRAIGMVGLLGAGVLMFAPSSVWQRLGRLRNVTSTATLQEADPEGSAEQRWQIWETAGRIIADHPMFGVGLGAYPAANEEYAPRDLGGDLRLGAKDTHSTYLNVMAELGVPGFLIFVALIVSVLRRAESVRKRARHDLPMATRQLYLLELGLLGFLTAAIWGSYARISLLYIYLALLYVMAEALAREQAELEALRRSASARRS